MEDLLPGAKDGSAIVEGDSERRPHPGGLKMGVGIAVMPSLLVAIVAARWNELVEDFRHVPLEAGFELDRANGTGGAYIEYVGRACLDTGIPDDGRNFRRNVLHVAVPGGVEIDFVLIGHCINMGRGCFRGFLTRRILGGLRGWLPTVERAHWLMH